MRDNMNYNRFFSRNAKIVAQDLVGKMIVRESQSGSTGVLITETGAYENGRTPSREGMLYAPGTIFLMPYRRSQLLNFATDKSDVSSCVEIREISYFNEKINGSGKIANELGITEDLDGQFIWNNGLLLIDPQTDIRTKRVSPKTYSGICLAYFRRK